MSDKALVEVYERQEHKNGDETALLLSALADGWQAVAVDVDQHGEILGSEEIGSTDEREKAVGMCEFWLDENPKGILGVADNEGGAGWMQTILGGGAEI